MGYLCEVSKEKLSRIKPRILGCEFSGICHNAVEEALLLQSEGIVDYQCLTDRTRLTKINKGSTEIFIYIRNISIDVCCIYYESDA